MKTKLFIFWISAVLLLAAGLTAPLDTAAGVNVNIGINLTPPAYVIHEPPPVSVIPGSYVYFVPGIRLDILFYQGYWYRPYEGRWYRGRSYNGPWHHIGTRSVPSVVLHLPPDYRHSRHDHGNIPYGQMQKNWRTWEKERYWDRHEVRHDNDRHREEARDSGRNHGGHGHHGQGRDKDY